MVGNLECRFLFQFRSSISHQNHLFNNSTNVFSKRWPYNIPHHISLIFNRFCVHFLYISFFPFSIFSIGIWNLMLYQFNLCPLYMYVIYEVKKSFLRKVPGISIAVSMFGHHSFFSWDMVFA